MTQAPILQSLSNQAGFVNAAPVVSNLTLDLGSGSEIEPLLERFLVSIVALAGAQAGAVRILSNDGKTMRLVAHQGLPAHVLSQELLVERDCGMCGAATGADVLGWVTDVRSCARHSGDTFFGQQCKQVLAISLPHDERVLGIYNLFFDADVNLSAPTQTILRLVGQLLGQALHNARVERERLHVTVMKERQEMLNEVHDAIAQTLAYVRMRLPLLNDAMLAHDDQKSLKYFSDVRSAVGEVHDNLREVMTYFRTRMDPLGLLHALGGIADGFFERNGIKLEIKNCAKNLNLSNEQEVQVFHIVQEALANIAKHSMARHAVLTIVKTPAQLELVIEDDGLGLSAPSVATIVTTATGSAPAAHFGLEIMHGRAKRLGGSLEVGQNQGGGTRVRLLLPLGPVPVRAAV